jgi:hypothetical protein
VVVGAAVDVLVVGANVVVVVVLEGTAVVVETVVVVVGASVVVVVVEVLEVSCALTIATNVDKSSSQNRILAKL